MWVARDEDGSLCICNTKPIRISKKWYKGYWDHDEFDGMLEIKDKSLFPNLTWEDEPIEVSLVPNKIDKGDKERKESAKKDIKEYTAEEIYYFEKGANPDYDEWVKAGIELEYGETEDDFEYNDYRLYRGDFDYTRD